MPATPIGLSSELATLGAMATGGAPSTPDALRARLEASRRALFDAIEGLDEEGFRRRPGPSQWSPAEVLAHLLLMEQQLLTWAQAALAAPDEYEFVWLSEDARRDQAQAAQRMPVPQILHGLLAQRRETVWLLETLDAGQLAKTCRVVGRGSFPVALLFQRMADHEEEHARQVREARAQAAQRAT